MSTAKKNYTLNEIITPSNDEDHGPYDYLILEKGAERMEPIGIFENRHVAMESVKDIERAKGGIVLDKDSVINSTFNADLAVIIDQDHKVREVRLENGGLMLGEHRDDLVTGQLAFRKLKPEHFVEGTILLFDQAETRH